MSETFVFNPAESLRKAREHQPALDEAYKKAEQAREDYIDPIVEFFAGLEDEIVAMTIASRFSRERTPQFEYATGRGIVNPQLTSLTEEQYKRAQLMSDLSRIRGMALSLSMFVESLVLDMEATKTE